MLVDGVAAISPLPGAEAGVVAFRTGGVLHATVITKATFAFAPDAPMPRVPPQPLLRDEVHHGENPARSVRFTSDLVPYLARADVLFTGHGHATAARLQVHAGERVLLDKTLLLKDSRGVQRIPIVYERAYGGSDVSDNPLGTGARFDEGEPTILTPGDPRRPAGFGPIARAWPARKRLLGATPRSALEGRIAEIPPGFDGAYFQAAPLDQQIELLRGDEHIVLEGLHPTLPRLVTRLPGLRGLARLHGLAAFGIPDGQPMDLCLDTLRIDGDEQQCTVVCRRWIKLPHERALEALRVVAGVEVAGEPLAWFDPPWRAAGPPPSSGKRGPLPTSTLALPPDVQEAPPPRPALPFRTGFLSAQQPEVAAPPPSPVAPPPSPVAPPPVPPRLPLTPPSALFASNAAADLEPVPEMQMATPAQTQRPVPARVFDLLWFDPRSLPRIRKQPAWRAILEALADEPLDPDIDDPELGFEPADVEERREVFEVLAHGAALGEEAIRAAVRGAIRKDGRFVAPLVLVEGDVSLLFDEIESLQALVAVVAPLAGGDDRSKEAVAAARDYLSAADSLRDPVAARELGAAIETAYAQAKKRVVSPAEVSVRMERVLLEHRRYQRQAVFGGTHLRGVVQLPGGEREMPVYFPEALVEVLPMSAKFSARLVAEAHLAADAQAACPVALRGVGITRIATTDGW
ncbi:DUF2169 family type VI secretion system accessory protein [Polyangium mundeleinium]|uniref:DUF2169 domain-containing protein n=1 Tax=Polyangium mundeleinium TaxID=2995306 RepID=A0ABT5EUY7_9BACT|nr:DUF2169 domain-containing protein [Polyangium mundeleinium]MDC0744595.1 DUF2169 domain-containing protein [Polyangium mundeleinium]